MKTLFIILFLLISIASFAQEFAEDHPELYIGKELIVKPPIGDMGYMGFFKHKGDTLFNKLGPDDMYQKMPRSYTTMSEALNGRTFKVVSVHKWAPDDDDTYALILDNTITGKVVYKYENFLQGQFERTFKVAGGIEVKEGNVVQSEHSCSDISASLDKFEESKTFDSPLLEKVSFTKVIKGGAPTYYLSLTAKASIPDRGKGFAILFKDGSKLIKPSEEVDTDVSEDAKFNHTIFYKLSSAEVEKFKTALITDFKVAYYSDSIDNSTKFRDYFNCLVSAE